MSHPELPLTLLLLAGLMAVTGLIGWARSKTQLAVAASNLYGSIVAHARHPALFEILRVPDTTEGRFEALVLHLALVLQRLRTAGPRGERLGQALNEQFISDMDDAMREIGIGDMGVPRRIQKAVAALGERFNDYRPELAAGRDTADLAATIGRHFGAGVDAGRLASYIRRAFDDLTAQPDSAILAGRLAFPEPVIAPERGMP